MNELFKKLQIKEQTRFLVSGVPEELNKTFSQLGENADDPQVIIAFFQDDAGVASAATLLKRHAKGDETLVWFCYPKKSSKRYKATIDRDHGWNPVLDLGWDGVRQVAVNEDWSALRFRPTSAIKNYTRKKRIGSD
mgnify:FL=1